MSLKLKMPRFIGSFSEYFWKINLMRSDDKFTEMQVTVVQMEYGKFKIFLWIKLSLSWMLAVELIKSFQ